MNVLNEIMQEDQQIFCYQDEKIASNIYLVSLSYAFRALNGMSEKERKEKERINSWLEERTKKVYETAVLNFDNIIKKTGNDSCSCDAFFYNFCPQEGELHYLAEMKNVNKKTILTLLEDNGKNGIYRKVKDSVQMIRTQLEFGGDQEQDDIVKYTHFFIVYAEKNDVASRNSLRMPKRTKVQRDSSGKQKKAGRMSFESEKKDLDILEHFGSKIQKLGLAACSEDLFPGEALPRARKLDRGKGRQRAFSMFSAQDFTAIVDSGFFADWKWGDYQPFFK